jgi:hypothetical protein
MNTLGFNREELRILRPLRTPRKIQDFLETIPINFEEKGDTCYSPRRVLREWKAQCLEGAMLAASALWLHGEPPLLVNLKVVTGRGDADHVLALFKRHGAWGAITKTNHAVLRYREPIYRSVRELAMSYFHEYFLDDGRKTMRSFSKPLDLRRFAKRGWTTTEKDLWYISDALDDQPHEDIATPAALRGLRRADPIEIQAGKLVLWRPKRR